MQWVTKRLLFGSYKCHCDTLKSFVISMAFYDNPHWLLSHIRDSFISSDETGLFKCILYKELFQIFKNFLNEYIGMCELVMAKDDIPKELNERGVVCTYPGVDDSDEEDLDALSDSYDIQMGKLCSMHSIFLINKVFVL